jgi:hypothetical protein
MGAFAEQVTAAAKRLAVAVTELEPLRSAELLGQVRSKYASDRAREPLWEHLKDQESIHAAESWAWLHEYIKGRSIIMFFEERDDRCALYFDNGGFVVPCLYDCYGFEFYLTDPECSFLVSFNHHDICTGCGEAKAWVRDMADKHGSIH